jgi:hypothetical protein
MALDQPAQWCPVPFDRQPDMVKDDLLTLHYHCYTNHNKCQEKFFTAVFLDSESL